MFFRRKPKNDDKPYISIVVTARNDDHGEKFLERMQIFVSGILEQLAKYDLSSELIIVEWNPPSDRPRLSEAISWSHEDGPCKIRIIEVPPEIHNRFQHSDKLLLFQYQAKNVGIRRARGEFVLATNVDILFSDELIKFLSSKSLKQKFFYRVDRYDVKSGMPYPASIEEQLDYCKHSVTNILTKDALHAPSGIPKLHLNACGDFTLMAREKWYALHGNPELEMYSIHLDSVLLHMAYQYGLKEKMLKDPKRTYHTEHTSGWDPDRIDEFIQGLEDKGLPYMDYEKLVSLAKQMQRERRPIIFNDENWGLKSELLAETIITS